MHDIALVLSIISLVLIIIYLIGLIFGRKKPDDEIKITLTGRIVQVTTTKVVDEHGRVVEGQVLRIPEPQKPHGSSGSGS